MTKICSTCSKEFERPGYISNANWVKRKYCSMLCNRNKPKKYSSLRQSYIAHNQKPKTRYAASRCTAKRRNLEWSLELDQYLQLISLPCHYCGGSLCKSGVGLDRLDNSNGYTLTNVVPCCGVCNVWRADHFTPEEVKVAMDAIRTFRQEKLNGLISI
jgi:hypothetical protein